MINEGGASPSSSLNGALVNAEKRCQELPVPRRLTVTTLIGRHSLVGRADRDQEFVGRTPLCDLGLGTLFAKMIY